MINYEITLKEFRKKRNISIRQLEKITGIPRGRLSIIENNKANPTLDTMLQICTGLNISIYEIIKTDWFIMKKCL